VTELSTGIGVLLRLLNPCIGANGEKTRAASQPTIEIAQQSPAVCEIR
jgi:hypothetical protein